MFTSWITWCGKSNLVNMCAYFVKRIQLVTRVITCYSTRMLIRVTSYIGTDDTQTPKTILFIAMIGPPDRASC